MKAVLVNYNWGHGPYVRAAQLAARTFPDDVRIIVPAIGGRQETIMSEELGDDAKRLLWDDAGGRLLRMAFYSGTSWMEWLERIPPRLGTIRDRLVERYSSDSFTVRGPAGDVTLHAENLVGAVSRNPLFPLLPGREVRTSFTTHTALWRACATDDPTQATVWQAAADKLESWEDGFCATLLGTPALALPVMPEHEALPPLVPPPLTNAPTPPAGRSIYLTISGIAGLKETYLEVSRDPRVVANQDPGSDCPIAPPGVRFHPQITAHWARPSWNAIWDMIVTGQPLYDLPPVPNDDPEIEWNRRTLRELGLWAQIDSEFPMERLEEVRSELLGRFGTLDGMGLASERVRVVLGIKSL